MSFSGCSPYICFIKHQNSNNLSFFPRKIPISRNQLILQLTVIVWGFTGILGSLSTISAIHLVWYRVLIAFVSLAIYFGFKRQRFGISGSAFIRFFLTGGLVGLHWILFFESISVSTVSVTLVCLSSVTLFTAIIEPFFFHRRISKLDVFTGLMIITGIYLIFRFETQYMKGIILGLVAALAASLFGIINSKLVKRNRATVIGFYEMLGAWIWISFFLLISGDFGPQMTPQGNDLFYLLLLGTVCTSAAYVAAVAVMKEISAFRVALISNMEPLYGIMLAWLFFGHREVMSLGFYLGALLILGVVFLHPMVKLRRDRSRQKDRTTDGYA